MKISVRRGVFETNSSSTHSITMCSDDDYRKWENGELFMTWGDDFITKDEVVKELKKDEYFNKKYPNFDFDNLENNEEYETILYDCDYYTYDTYWERKCEYYEGFEDSYVTKNGDKVICFGYYGHDC